MKCRTEYRTFGQYGFTIAGSGRQADVQSALYEPGTHCHLAGFAPLRETIYSRKGAKLAKFSSAHSFDAANRGGSKKLRNVRDF